MANIKVSALTALTGANVENTADLLAVVDTSATTTKKILVEEIAIAILREFNDFTALAGSGVDNSADSVLIYDASATAAKKILVQELLTIPQNSQSTAYTLLITDAGKHILHPASDNNPRTFTIPANASVAYPVGTAVTFVNMINTLSIAITTDTMTLMGAGSTGTRTLAANGIATALKIATTAWVISGTNLS